VNKILSDLGLAVRVTSAVTLVAGILVLAGAITSGRRQRVYDAVVLKVLGATRARILGVLLAEYAILGLATAAIAAGAGALAAWFVVAGQMEAPFRLFPATIATTVAVSAAVTIFMGLAGTWSVLGQKPAPVLRSE
jgi:putative ABC transport system permease protein